MPDTVTPLHATWTVNPDGTPNPSVGVAFMQVLPSGRSLRVDAEVPLEEGELDQPWGSVCTAIFRRAMAQEGFDTLTPPPATGEADAATEGSPATAERPQPAPAEEGQQSA